MKITLKPLERFALAFVIAVVANIFLMKGLLYFFTPPSAMLASSVLNVAGMLVYFVWSMSRPLQSKWASSRTPYLQDINNFDFRTGKWKDGRDEV